MRFLLGIIINAFAIWVVTLIPALGVAVVAFPPGTTLEMLLTLLAVGAIFGIVNAIVGTVIRVVAFPVYILTLGFISLIVNGFLLWLTGWITSAWPWGLRVESFWWGVVAALLIWIINWILSAILRPRRRR